MGEQRLGALAVRLPAEDAAAGRHAHDERAGELRRSSGSAAARPRRRSGRRPDTCSRRTGSRRTGRSPYAAMPTAAPTMPSSLIGVSKQRRVPYFACRPCVARNTPPKKPTSSPNTTTSSSRSIITSMASRIASIMVLRGMAQTPACLALPAQMRRHLRIDAFEHVAHRRSAAGVQRAVAFRFPLRRHDRVHDLRFRLPVAFLRPDAAQRQVVLQPDHRVTERPGIGFGLRAGRPRDRRMWNVRRPGR